MIDDILERMELRMFTAFAHVPHKPLRQLHSFEELEEAWKDPHVRVWVDIEGPTEEDLRRLDMIVDVDDSSLETSLSIEEEHPRVDEFADHIFLLLYGVLAPENQTKFAPRKLTAFCGKRYLITIQHERHRTIDKVRQRFASHGVHIISRGVDFLLYAIIDGIVDNYSVALTEFEEKLEGLEEESLENASDHVFTETAKFRRQLLELRRLALAQREAIRPLARGECDYVAPTLGRRFSHVSDHLTRVVELADTLREVLGAIRENYQSLMARRTNEIMRTLTILSTMLLPMSLIASIYGMNLKTFPTDGPYAFWIVIGTMVAIGLSMGLYFRNRRWL